MLESPRTLLYLLSFRDETNITHMVGQSRFHHVLVPGVTLDFCS